MKYRILGNGYIGSYLLKHLPDALVYRNRINSEQDIIDMVSDIEHDDVFINCIGRTGRPNIDWCEDHKSETAHANIMVPVWLADACQRTGRYWVHIGSGCIYDGYERVWSELDPPNFYGSIYSLTKAVSQSVLATYKDILILRIRMPIDEDMNERCYISKLVRYIQEGKSLFNAKNSMTYLADMVHVIKTLVNIRATGTFNVVNPGALTAQEVLDIYDSSIKACIVPQEMVQVRLKARRSNCILSIDKLEMLGIRLPDLVTRIREMRRVHEKTFA